MIDRTIAVLVAPGGVVSRFLSYAPRLLFAVLAAFLVSESIVVAVYQKEINEHMRVVAEESRPARIAAESPNFIAPSDAVVAEEQKIADLRNRITDLNNRAAEEANGDGATGVLGCGRVCRGFIAERVAAEKELDAAESRLAAAKGAQAEAQAQAAGPAGRQSAGTRCRGRWPAMPTR